MPILTVKPTWVYCDGTGNFGDPFGCVGGSDGYRGPTDPCPPGFSRALYGFFAPGWDCFPNDLVLPLNYYGGTFGGFSCNFAPANARNCHGRFVPGGGGGGHAGWSVDCECPTCPPGFSFDPLSQLCLSAFCPAGQCWCAASNECINCTSGKVCDGVAVNTWNNLLCKWIPVGPDCGPNSYFNWGTCSCAPCPPKQCNCFPLNRCTPCENGLTPRCSAERHCFWYERYCRWECSDPVCAAGNHFDLKVCRCIPDCPTGNCWCESASPPQCISCTPPLCAKYLNCEWNVATCTWECDSPPCDIALFDYAKCKCKPLHLLWLIRDEKNRLIRWSADASGHLVQEIFEPGDVAPTATVIDPDHECDSACFHAINGWLVGTYLADGVLTLGKSRDHGKTWTMKPIPGDYTFARSVWHRKRLVVVGYRAGNLYVRVGKLLPDNDFDWSDPEVAVTPTLPHTSNGDLSLWVDGTTIVMTWGDTTNQLHLSKCGFLKLDGTNLWRHES